MSLEFKSEPSCHRRPIGPFPAVALFMMTACITSHAVGQTLLGSQNFEGNSEAVVVTGGQAGTPVGALSPGQQTLELIDTGDFAANGNPIKVFTQPSVTFDPVAGTNSLPFMETGRVFDSGGGMPWRLKWFNSRITDQVLLDAAAAKEAADEAFAASQGFPIDLTYIPLTEAADLIGPVVFAVDPNDPSPDPPGFNIATGIFNATTNTFTNFNAADLNGITNDNVDAFGVGGSEFLGEFDGPAGEPPEGEQAMFLVDGDGTFLLEFDPVDATGFNKLTLSFFLAAGGNSNTTYGDFDSIGVEVNGVPVFGPLNGDSELNELTSPQDPLDVFANGDYQFIEVDISQFAGESEVAVTFVADNNNGDNGNNVDAFSIDDIRIVGDNVEGVVGDFNGDGVVDGVDYAIWRSALGDTVAPGSGPDADGDGLIGSSDFNAWRDNFGATVPVAAIATPEPAACGTLVIMAFSASVVVRRRPSFEHDRD